MSGWRGETDELYKMEKRIECDHQYIRDCTVVQKLVCMEWGVQVMRTV